MPAIWHTLAGEDSEYCNFYTNVLPYLRKTCRVSSTGNTSRFCDINFKDKMESEAREEGYVPFEELPEEIVEYWARSDAYMMVDSIAKRLARTWFA